MHIIGILKRYAEFFTATDRHVPCFLSSCSPVVKKMIRSENNSYSLQTAGRLPAVNKMATMRNYTQQFA